jgi:hypothetical protein
MSSQIDDLEKYVDQLKADHSLQMCSKNSELTETSKKYDELLEDYDDACNQIVTRNRELAKLEENYEDVSIQLVIEKLLKKITDEMLELPKISDDEMLELPRISAIVQQEDIFEDCYENFYEDSESELDTSVETVVERIHLVHKQTQTDILDKEVEPLVSSLSYDSGVCTEQEDVTLLMEDDVINSHDNQHAGALSDDSSMFADNISSILAGREDESTCAVPYVKTSTPLRKRHTDQYRSYSLRKNKYQNSSLRSQEEQEPFNSERSTPASYEESETTASKEKSRRSIEKLLRTSPKDRSFMLSLNKLMNDFILGDLSYLKSPSFNSYDRMLVHEMAEMQGLLHTTQDGCVLVSKKAIPGSTINLQVYMLHRSMYASFDPLRVNITEDN